MVRGVNKRIIEITNTGNDSFERVFVVLREGITGKSEAALGEAADRYVQELAKNHRSKPTLGERALPFVAKKAAPIALGGMATAVKRKTKKDKGAFWLFVLILSLLLVAAAVIGLIL